MPAPPQPRPCNHLHPGRSRNLSGVRQGRFFSRCSARLRVRARCCPACFLTAYPQSAVFRNLRIHFALRSAGPKSDCVNAKKAPNPAGRWTVDPGLNAWPERPCACPRIVCRRGWTRFLLFRGRDPNFVRVQKKMLTRLGNPCDVRACSSGTTRSPHKEKKKGKKHEC